MTLTTLREHIAGYPITLWEHFYFAPVRPTVYRRAERLAKKLTKIIRGRQSQSLNKNTEVVGKVGEFLVQEFGEHYFQGPWESYVEVINESGGDVTDLHLHSHPVDVKTRHLQEDVTIKPGFELRVPHFELDKYQSAYILAGYCRNTGYGYLFGWASWEELQARPIREDIPLPAKCVPLLDLHPMLELEPYLQQRPLP